MNPNYTEFRFPIIKPCPWNKVCLQIIYNPFVSFSIYANNSKVSKKGKKNALEMCLGLSQNIMS